MISGLNSKKKKGLFARFDVVDEVKGSGVTKQSESENYHKTIKPSSFTQEAAEGLRSKKKKGLFAGVDTVNESKDSSGLKETKNNPKHYCKNTKTSSFMEESPGTEKNKKPP